ncbi:transposase [Streptosporangium roseum]|uniref:transposase n=1 Tax=Streptosporangium roseum TaxID=2001 RepID=UPI001FE09195|nr:transposase [Streptosporangium roseum]
MPAGTDRGRAPAADQAAATAPGRAERVHPGRLRHRHRHRPLPGRAEGGAGGTDTKRATFDTATCALCPLRQRCTIARGGRVVQIRPDHDLQVAARRGTPHGSGSGKVRWVVERTFAWLRQFNRLRIRYERRADLRQALLDLACSIICLRRLRTSF